MDKWAGLPTSNNLLKHIYTELKLALLLLSVGKVDKYAYSYVYSPFWLFLFVFCSEDAGKTSCGGTSKSLMLLEILSLPFFLYWR